LAKDTSELARNQGRAFQDEHKGPIMTWEDFERFPWPNPEEPSASEELEWFQNNLPEDMCIVGSGRFGHFSEWLTWLMGYETLCYSLYDQRDLVRAIAERLREYYRVAMRRFLEFDRVRILWGCDDMGFKSGLLISADDTREFVLPGHKDMAQMAHAAGRLYLLHSCGNLAEIIYNLIDDVKIDAKHSFEDTIEDVRHAKRSYGQRVAVLGGIDVDFLCRSDEQAIRKRVRNTLEICMPGGGYCLGTGSSVANYIPLENYLTMVDEGMLYAW
jgi:uroporphyrinogen decarboxylase